MMRTTLSIPDDVLLELRERARSRRASLTRIVAETLRAGLRPPPGRPKSPPLPVFDMGEPSINLDKALFLAGALEDEGILRKMDSGK